MKTVYTLSLFLFVSTFCLAQPADPDNPVPIDGGLSILLASGAALGAARYKALKKQKQEM
jgi:hypothetical protein